MIASTLDVMAMRAMFGDTQRWRHDCAELWREWVTLCAYSQIYDARCVCNYGVPSQINTARFGTVDEALLAQHRQILFRASGLSAEDFAKRLSAITIEISGLYRQDKYDSVFKGKWYALFLMEAVNAAAAGRAYDRQALEGKLINTLAATLLFYESWVNHFRKKLGYLLIRYHLVRSVPMTLIGWLWSMIDFSAHIRLRPRSRDLPI